MKVGIDRIGFYTPNKYLDLVDLALARKQDPNKFIHGIGQAQMSIADLSQDVVSMGINATLKYLPQIDQKQVGLLIVGTESSVDQSKSASLFMKGALGLKPEVLTFEIKEACFGLTAALMMARDYVEMHPEQSAIVIGSDIAKYGLNTPGEVTQGAGSISILVKKDPAIMTIDNDGSTYSEDLNDFWRPNNYRTALVDGRYSTKIYLKFFNKTFNDHKEAHNLNTSDFSALLYHLPFVKMGQKANRLALKGVAEDVSKSLIDNFKISSEFGKRAGNMYTASLYASLLSLLENVELSPNSLIGMFSYGSGAMGEFFTGRIVEGYQNVLTKELDDTMLDHRKRLTVAEYEDIFTKSLDFPKDLSEIASDAPKGTWYFAGLKDQIRQYREVGKTVD